MHPCLYDQSVSNFDRKDVKLNLWNELMLEFDFSSCKYEVLEYISPPRRGYILPCERGDFQRSGGVGTNFQI